MTIGEGKYDKPCTLVREMMHAEGVFLFVLNGDRGSGFSIQAPLHSYPYIADMLRHVAATIEKDLPEMQATAVVTGVKEGGH